jgi:hypothetical protein
MSRPVIDEASRQLGFPPDFLRRLSMHSEVTLVIDVPEVPDGVPAVARDDHPGRGRGVIKGGRVGTP